MKTITDKALVSVPKIISIILLNKDIHQINGHNTLKSSVYCPAFESFRQKRIKLPKNIQIEIGTFLRSELLTFPRARRKKTCYPDRNYGKFAPQICNRLLMVLTEKQGLKVYK